LPLNPLRTRFEAKEAADKACTTILTSIATATATATTFVITAFFITGIVVAAKKAQIW
jgi:putative exporter of polyketide antibiotics